VWWKEERAATSVERSDPDPQGDGRSDSISMISIAMEGKGNGVDLLRCMVSFWNGMNVIQTVHHLVVTV
jgi:hypothetical protein